MKYNIICVDYQKEFCDPIGIWYKDRPCHSFIKKVLTPFLSEHGIKMTEIISDYRLPRPSEHQAYCIPGTPGYESDIPAAVKQDNYWIKAMNSPDWTRKNAGNTLATGEPFPAREGFKNWLKETIGEPARQEVVLIGLTLDCCVLCTAQQLYFLGYKVRILVEGVDVYDPSAIKKIIKPEANYKDALFSTALGMFSSPIYWKELKLQLEKISRAAPSLTPVLSSSFLRSRM